MDLHNLPTQLKTLDYLDFEIKVPQHKCDHCEKIKDLELRINPYRSDIGDITDWEFICDDCYGELCADI